MKIKFNHFVNENDINIILYRNRNNYTYDHSIIYLQKLVNYTDVNLNKYVDKNIIQSVGLRMIIESVDINKYYIKVVFGDFRTSDTKTLLKKYFPIYDSKQFFLNIKSVFNMVRNNNYFIYEIENLTRKYDDYYFKKLVDKL